MNKLTVLLGLVGVTLSPSAIAQMDVNKCYSEDGKVTYTDKDCPEGYKKNSDDWIKKTPINVSDSLPETGERDLNEDQYKQQYLESQ